MSTVVTFFNAKGGVGKTTSSVNTADWLRKNGHTVALVNLDPQGNMFRFDQVLLGLATVDASGEFPDQAAITGALVAALEQLANNDFILIDCPPSPQECNQAALALSHLAIAPMQPAILSADGIGQIQQLIARVRRDGNPGLQWRVLVAMQDARNPYHAEMAELVRSTLGDLVLPFTVMSSLQFDGAAIDGMSIFDFSPRSNGARAYAQLGAFVLEQAAAGIAGTEASAIDLPPHPESASRRAASRPLPQGGEATSAAPSAPIMAAGDGHPTIPLREPQGVSHAKTAPLN